MARKQVTIPLGFNTANIDIGNKNQVSGLNWEFWYAYIGDVRNTLGETNYNLGLLCKSTNINIFAAFKPTQHIPQTVPKHYHGWDLDPITEQLAYQRPTNITGYALDHFLGYNHNAVTPGEIRFDHVSGYIYRVFDTLVEQSVGLLIVLPEFDLRDISNQIEGVIATVQGTEYYEDITNAGQTDGETLVSADVTPANQTKFTFTVSNISLGKLNLGVPDPFCFFPTATGTQVDHDVDLYRIIHTVNSWHGEIAGEGLVVIVTLNPFHADILVQYEVQKWDGSAWQNLYTGTEPNAIDNDVVVGESYTYRGRVVYNRGGGTANINTGYIETIETVTSEGSPEDPPI